MQQLNSLLTSGSSCVLVVDAFITNTFVHVKGVEPSCVSRSKRDASACSATRAY